MNDLVAEVAALPGPLEQKLVLLRERAAQAAEVPRLIRWAEDHPEISRGSEWCSRAWWGAAAGEIVRDYLYDPQRRAEALRLVESAEYGPLDEARRRGGVIIVAAHLGPPKFLMNCLLEHDLPLVVWTNTRDLPAWLAERGKATFLDPLAADQRATLLVKSALHLRGGGVLLGAADHASGDRTVVLDRLGMRWRFSLGLPTLAGRLGLPVVVALAGWTGERIRITCRSLEPPPVSGTAAADWSHAWLARYWECIEPTVRHEPENLRFLRWAVARVVPPPLGSESETFPTAEGG
jgi:hypothetical protein